MKIYISGPMTGLTEHRIKHHFGEAEKYLRQEGFTPVNPAVLQGVPGLEYDEYMAIDFAMLSICDAIYMLKGWEDSPGAKLELEQALKNDKKIILEK